ncbi:tRNA-dihydrouridine synthase A-like protein [Trifolium pratense]|uniref:tRNA-dihydrouridine synthase A-like protein n=1 Tax=Trifolium pratense TaxID=57577 RepID=A0A2K3P387_TRIPR|nr:tRNA-dihydrouridine synthase A-like protein [Trifolium pratense]
MSLANINAALKTGAHGVMVGRAAYHKKMGWKGARGEREGESDEKVKSDENGVIFFCLFFELKARASPWHLLGNVDSAIYGVPSIGLTRRQVIEKYQVYGDSVLLQYGLRPTVRDIVKPLLGFFHGEPGNGLWKRKADSAFHTCTTIKSFLEETLVAIPDSVLDSSFAKAPLGREDIFANIGSLMPPPYRTRDEDAV